MVKVVGDIETKIGSQNYITLQLVQEDGITPISLLAAVSATFQYVDVADDTIKVNFNTTDNPQKFFITDAANGKVELRPAVDDFTVKGLFRYHVIIIDSVGPRPAPVGGFYTLEVMDIQYSL